MPATPVHVAVLGGGPIGLETALAAAERGLAVSLVEQGPHVGAHVRDWGHVRMFTPWPLCISPRAAHALGRADLLAHPTCPTGAELLEQALLPLGAALAERGVRLRTGTRVVGVSRTGLVKSDEIGTGGREGVPFRLLLDGPRGESVETADVVVDCTGSYGQPNHLGDGGIPAPGERALAGRILRRVPSPAQLGELAGARVLLVGAGFSAQTAARDLAALPGTAVLWAVRAAKPRWGAVAGDTLPARAELTGFAARAAGGAVPGVRVRTGMVVERLDTAGAGGRGPITATLRDRSGVGTDPVEVDAVVGLTGTVGDADLYRQLQVHECYATAAPMNLAATLLGEAAGDCLAQPKRGVDVLRSPEPDFFVLGAKSYGRNSQFLLRVGWDQVDAVTEALISRASAA